MVQKSLLNVSDILTGTTCHMLPVVVRDPESRYNHLLQLITTSEETINKYRTSLSLSSINTSTQALEVC